MQLVIDSKFRPFSYDELVKPLTQYKEAYDKVEAQYSDLVSQTEQWKDIANRTKSPEAYAMYSKFANDLNNIVDDFSRGMTLQNRSQLMSMKRRYASEILPIARASEAMKEANDLRVKASPDAIFEVGEYDSLDQFLHGKTANNRLQSRDALTKRTAAMTEAVMASTMKDPDFKKALGNQYWEIIQHTGDSYENLKAAIANNPQAQNRFAEIKAQVMKEAGYDRYDAMGKQAIESAINTGLYAGLDKPVRSFQANQNFMSDYQKANLQLAKNADARAERQLALSAASAGLVYNRSTGKWERDPTLMMGPTNPDGSVSGPSEADLKKMGYAPEVDSNKIPTGRMITRDKKGNLKVLEQTPNGWIPSREKDPDTYMKKKEEEKLKVTNSVIKANKDNLTPFYFRAWSQGGSKGFEDWGSWDPNFSSRDEESKTLSTSSNGGLHGQSREAVLNYVKRFAGLQNAGNISDERLNQVADKYFRIYRDTDWFSNNHYRVAFINTDTGKEFSRKEQSNGDLKYEQDEAFRATYRKMRDDLLSVPSSVTQ